MNVNANADNRHDLRLRALLNRDVCRRAGHSAALAAALALMLLPAVRAEVLFTDVDRAVQRGVRFLKLQQDPRSGQWKPAKSAAASQPEDPSGLATLALLSSGLDTEDLCVIAGLRHLRGAELKTTRGVALQTLALSAGDPLYDYVLLQQQADALQKLSAGDAGISGRLAVLALHEAHRAGVAVAAETWQRAAALYVKQQHADGSWSGLSTQEDPAGMTPFTMAALVVLRAELPAGDPALKGSDAALARGLDWLSGHFPLPGNRPARGLYTCLYALAQYGHYSHRYFIGNHSWWKEGAQLILHEQRPDGSWQGTFAGEDEPLAATSVALLFLAESPRPPDLGEARRPHHAVQPTEPSAKDLQAIALGRLRLLIPIERLDGDDLQFSPDGRWLATSGLTRWVRLWDAASGKLTREIPRIPLFGGRPAFSPDSRWLALADVNLPDKMVLWSLQGGRPRLLDQPHTAFSTPSFSRDARLLLAVAGREGCVLWDVASGRRRAVFKPRSPRICEAVLSPDGKTVAALNAGVIGGPPVRRIVQLWDVDPPRERAVLDDDVTGPLAFSPDGKTLATGEPDHSVRLWDVATGRMRAACRGHLRGVDYLVFSPHGTLLASSGGDRFIELWDVARGGERAVFFGHSASVKSIAFSPDGNWLASSAADKTAQAAAAPFDGRSLGRQGCLEAVTGIGA